MGGTSVALVVAIHYAIATTRTVVFYLLSRRLMILTRHAAQLEHSSSGFANR
jgi:hypothetical protein